jgi:hypothetical protein
MHYSKSSIGFVGNELEANEWNVLGFISASFLESIEIELREQWTIMLTSEQITGIYDEWERVRLFWC